MGVAKNPTKKRAAAKKPQVKELTRGEKNIKWIETYCRIPEGKFVGRPVRLSPFQDRELRRIYDNPKKTRRAILSFGRKNAKTTLAAFIVLLHLCGPEARPNSQIYSAAQSREQAAVLFALAAKIIRMNPDLADAVDIKESGKQLVCFDLGVVYRALSAEASTAYGLSPVLVIHDELGQVKGPTSELYDAMETATAAQEDPLSIVISTQAPTDGDLLSILIDDALAGYDPRAIVSLYTAPIDLDPFDDATIRLANPAFDEFMNVEEVRSMAEDARRMPSKENSYRNLVLNQRIDANSPFVSRATWLSCGDPVIASFAGREVFGGLDLSEVADLTAFVGLSAEDRRWHCRPTFWLPGDGLREKSLKDRVSYDVWAKQGHLQALDSATIEYEWVAQWLFKLATTCTLKKVHFDRWNYKHLKPWLIKAGFTEEQVDGDKAIFVGLGQGFESMSPALRTLESAILNKQLAHANHPVLTMCANNARVRMDPAGNRKLTKEKSHGRIDGMVALAMAMSAAGTFLTATDTPPQYQMMVI